MDKINQIKKNYDMQIENIHNYTRLIEKCVDIPNVEEITKLVDDILYFNICLISEETLINDIENYNSQIELVQRLMNYEKVIHELLVSYYESAKFYALYEERYHDYEWKTKSLIILEIEREAVKRVENIIHPITDEVIENLVSECVDWIIDKYHFLDQNNSDKVIAQINDNRYGFMEEVSFRLYDMFSGKLSTILSRIETFNTSILVNSSTDILNVYRQTFILILATFDATMFDITRCILNKNFFKNSTYFCKNDKKFDKSIKISAMGQYSDYEDFSNNMIETMLKSKYIRDLIEDYKALNIKEINSNYNKIIEIINRRNAHIHNNGIADEKYIAEYNLYNKSCGEILEIDSRYCYEVYLILSRTIRDIVDEFDKNF